ncbi:MAG: ABC transporter permease [Acidobacteria bacterium]|nr:ABC transporter permease [Acidobacteriota bacterium]
MFVRLVYESFRRQTRRKLLAGTAVTLGAAVATTMLALALSMGDKMSRELRSYGANLVVTPEEERLEVSLGSVDLTPAAAVYLNEDSLPRIKGIFWANNIVGFTPELLVKVSIEHQDVTMLGTYFAQPMRYGSKEFTSGARATFPWWKVYGDWPQDNSQDVLVGEKLAQQLSIGAEGRIMLNRQSHRVSGIIRTGDAQDGQIIAPLHLAQAVAGRPGAVQKIFVSALTKPEDEFARRNPDSLSPRDRDRWYCSPYAQSIAYQLQEAIPHSHAEQIRRIAQNEGQVLSRIEGLMMLITLAALLTSALAVSSAMATAMFERRAEVALMKALGAGYFALTSIFVVESVLLAIVGGLVGFAGGVLLANQFGSAIFDSKLTVEPVLLPVIVVVSIAVSVGGSAAAIRRAVKYDPVLALRGEA